jgi:hypothetical protein
MDVTVAILIGRIFKMSPQYDASTYWKRGQLFGQLKPVDVTRPPVTCLPCQAEEIWFDTFSPAAPLSPRGAFLHARKALAGPSPRQNLHDDRISGAAEYWTPIQHQYTTRNQSNPAPHADAAS